MLATTVRQLSGGTLGVVERDDGGGVVAGEISVNSVVIAALREGARLAFVESDQLAPDGLVMGRGAVRRHQKWGCVPGGLHATRPYRHKD